MAERDKLAFQQNKKTRRAASLRKVLDDWARDYRDVLKVEMSSAYDTVFDVEKSAIKGKKVKKVDKPPRLILGATVPATASTSAIRYRKYVDNRVKQGFSDGHDVYSLIAGTASLRGKDGAVYARDTSAVAHIGNSVMTGANDGTKTAYLEKDVRTLKWISVLDGKTCQQCAGLDQRTFKVGGDTFMWPPAHSHCRCKMVEHFPDIEGERGALEDFELKPKNHPDRIDAKGVPIDQSFKEWFPTTSKTFQKEYLGPTKYKAYKDGTFKFDQFSDDKTGRIYTLEDLGLEQIYN
jgi:hypothetical protein